MTIRDRRRQARAHDALFRAEVEQGLREADDPATRRISDEDVMTAWRRRRAELEERRAGLLEEQEDAARGRGRRGHD